MVDLVMRRVLIWFLGWSVLAAPCVADELTDAIVGADPTARLESGLGVAVGSYVEGLEAASQPDAVERPFVPSLRETPERTGLSRSPWQLPDHASESEELEEPQEEWSTDVRHIPLGKPYQRNGVWYEDDRPARLPP